MLITSTSTDLAFALAKLINVSRLFNPSPVLDRVSTFNFNIVNNELILFTYSLASSLTTLILLILAIRLSRHDLMISPLILLGSSNTVKLVFTASLMRELMNVL